MSLLEAGITQLATKAAKGDFKAIKEVIRLSKEVQEQDVHLNAPRLMINFIKPPDEKEASGEKNGSNDGGRKAEADRY